MDIATILGIVSGLSLVAIAIMGKGSLATFIDVPSMLIVVGGTFAAIFVNFTIKEVIGVLSVVKKAFENHESTDLELIRTFEELAVKARKEGILAIDRSLEDLDDEFMQEGLELAVDGTDPETLETIMESEISYTMERHKKGQKIFTSLGTYSPAFGMIGTLIGLINMLQGLDDPSSIGAGMATALITTFYGALIANLIFLPIAGKLKIRSDEEIIIKEMIIDGVLSIQSGDHPRSIRTKLLNYLPRAEREQYNLENE
ncbi:MAG: motility protein A [Candidatus Marinimicrobia bacterium]|nr:motility protein A [Candidatus Neomarinimicrobiota bacterium]